MVGRVGADTFGPILLDGLQGYGVGVEGVAEDPDNASGVAIILLDSSKQNHILAVCGANAACDNAQLEAAKRALDRADALLLQLEVPFDISLAAARHARSLGVKVIWDPAPALDQVRNAYDAVDVLTPNQTEATFLTGVDVTDVASAMAAAEALRGMGVHVGPFDVDAVDTIAAGDAFGAGLAVALCEGKSVRDSVRLGAAAGALAVTRPGAQEAMPERHEAEALVSRS